MKPKVAIIYLSYNSVPYFPEVVAAWEKLQYPKESTEIIIVDNDSKDGSQEWVREHILPKVGHTLPRVTFFPNKTNEGFAGGNNQGMEHALLEGFDYVYLHNNDLRLAPDTIDHAVQLAESDASIGSIQSFMKLWQDESVINSTGGMTHFLGFGFVRDNGRKVTDVSYRDGEEIFYASGAAVLYRASVLREVGFLDPHLFLYHEDLQLGWRIRLSGRRNVLSTKSVAFHKYEFKKSIQKFYWMERNRLLVHATYLKIPTLLLLCPFMLGLEIALIGFGIKGGWIKEKLLGYRDLLSPRTWKYIAKTRKEIAQIRKVPDREITKHFVSKIAHQETNNPIVEKIGNPLLSLVWFALKRVIVW